MDTKLKKAHKLKSFIITLFILLPAFLLTALYPEISKAMEERRVEIEREFDVNDENTDLFVSGNFINYAVESCYYLYGMILEEVYQDANQGAVNFSVLEQYGWDNDYRLLDENVKYQATYTTENFSTGITNADVLEREGDLGYITLKFNVSGRLEALQLSEGLENYFSEDSNVLWDMAYKSMKQYKNNAQVYEEEQGINIDENELVPKNLEVTFAINGNSDFFVWDDGIDAYHFMQPGYLLWQVGIVLVLVIAAVFVAIMALILPFFKKLQTGWEKLFCIPFEILLALVAGLIAAVYGMYYAMAYTCALTPADFLDLKVVGMSVNKEVQYGFLLVVNFIGWAICFFLEYVIVASFRQFLCKPVYYMKHRVWIVRFFGFIKKQCIRLYRYVTNIDISEKLNSSIMKIVLVNFAILTVLCFMWLFGIPGLVVYSVVLYILLRKYGKKLQNQYLSIMNASQQMAKGNLKVQMDEELGLFQPIGDALQDVQKGFSKAVAEEAKSQSMKTELITNVSHDLKTPLTAIITYVDLLKQEDITDEEQATYIATLEQKSQRLKILIEDLFEISKAQSGNVTMNYMDVDVVSLMKQVRLEMSDQLEASNLTFRWNIPKEKVMLSLDGQRTYRVFENLLGNALKYAMPYTRVYVDVVDESERVKIVFRNISSQELNFDAERLTERFVRGDASRNSEGSGLGLAIAKSFVELQNGTFEIEVDGDLFKVIIIWNK